MNQDDLARHMAKDSIFSIAKSKMAIEAVFNAISDALVQHEHIKIRGFGVFDAKLMPERKRCKAINGEMYTHKAHYLPKFTPGKTLKSRVERSIKKRRMRGPQYNG